MNQIKRKSENVLVDGLHKPLINGGAEGPHSKKPLVKDCLKCFQIIIQIIIKNPNGKQFLCMFFKKTER
jgi:hypothetical protein